MLPFARPLVYNNRTVPAWYSGSNVLMAYDSQIFRPSTGFNTDGFIDYKGLSITADAQTAGLLPGLGTSVTSTINPFGSYGILLYGSGLVANNSQVPASLTQQDYSIDFWFRNTSYPNDTSLELVPFSWYSVMSSNSNKWCMWAYFKDTTGPRYQNNNVNTTRAKSFYAPMYNNTNWNHYAYTFVKSTNTHRVFINGTLIDSFTLTVATPGTAGAKFGVAGHVNSQNASGGTSPHTAIDRYRVQSTAVWTSNFSLSTLYPQ